MCGNLSATRLLLLLTQLPKISRGLEFSPCVLSRAPRRSVLGAWAHAQQFGGGAAGKRCGDSGVVAVADGAHGGAALQSDREGRKGLQENQKLTTSVSGRWRGGGWSEAAEDRINSGNTGFPDCYAWRRGCGRGGGASKRPSTARGARLPRRFAGGGSQETVEDLMCGYALLQLCSRF